MKPILKSSFSAFVSLCFVLNFACSNDKNPVSAQSLVGTWNLVSMTDKTGDEFELGPNVTIQANQPYDLGGGATLTLSATLVLTETRYTLTFTLTTQFPGFPPDVQTETGSGTYEIDGNTIRTTDDNDTSGTQDESSISVNGNQMTIDDDDLRLVFQKV